MEHLLYPSLFNPYGVILWIHLSQRDFYWGASDKLDALIDSFSILTLVIKHNHGITKGSKTRICEMGNTFLQILNFLRRYPFFGNFMPFISCPFFWRIWGTPKIINIITKCAHITHDLCKMSFFFFFWKKCSGIMVHGGRYIYNLHTENCSCLILFTFWYRYRSIN